MPYRLEYRAAVEKELRKIPKKHRLVLVEKIRSLGENPRPTGFSKLKGSQELFRIWYGTYRIIYQIQDDVLIILIIRVGHRREIYKKL